MDPRIRNMLGSLYPVLMGIKGARSVRMARALPGALSYLSYRKGAKRRFGLDIDAPIGMGAVIAHALLHYAHFSREECMLYLRATSPLYSEGGRDVLAEFFERDPWPADLAQIPASAAEYLTFWERRAHLDLAQARRLYAQHFRPNARLRAAIEQAAEGVARYDLSIHFRGTDKFLESGKVAHEVMLERLAPELTGLSSPNVFLATDDAGFSAAVRHAFPSARFTSYDLGEVGDGVPRHFSQLPPSAKALEALVNIYLIARAPVCIRTSSYLSSVSALVNPDMRTVTIDKTRSKHTPFPEFELLEAEALRASAGAMPVENRLNAINAGAA
ncbi:hypothetical protein OSJ57_19150 [Sphingomonas sp. HH69]